MRSLEQVNIRTNVRTYVRTYSHTYVRDRPYIPSTTLLCEGITTLVVLSYTMLHTKFQGHWSTGSGEEDFLRFLPLYWHGGHVGHVTQTI